MTTTMKRGDLSAALKLLVKASDPRSSIAILGSIRIEAQKGKVQLAATDLELRLEATIDGDGDLAPICLPAKDLLAAVKATKDNAGDVVSISVLPRDEDMKDRETATVEVAGLAMRIMGYPADDYPTPYKVPTTKPAELTGLGPGLAFVLPAMSQDITRPKILVLHLDSDGTMVATDGHCLHTTPFSGQLRESITISRQVALLLEAVTKVAGDTVGIHHDLVTTEIRIGAYTILARTHGDEFPPWHRTVPNTDNNRYFNWAQVTVDAKELDARLAQLMTRERVCGVLELGQDELILTRRECQAEGIPEIRTTVPATIIEQAEGTRPIGLGMYLFRQALGPKPKGLIKLFIANPLDPIVVQQGDHKGVVMPMRI